MKALSFSKLWNYYLEGCLGILLLFYCYINRHYFDFNEPFSNVI